MSSIVSAAGKLILLEGDELTHKHLNDPKSYAQFIINQINTEHIYDKWLKDKKDLVILDIGANVGLFTVYAQDVAKRIVAVEPTPAHIHVFKQLTSQYTNVEIVEAVLIENDGPVTFYISSENSTANSIIYKSNDAIEVRGICFKTLLDSYNIDHVDFAKIDIEGGEKYALTVENIKSVYDKISCMFVECHCTEWPWNPTAERNVIINRFLDAGYKVDVIDFATFVAYKE